MTPPYSWSRIEWISNSFSSHFSNIFCPFESIKSNRTNFQRTLIWLHPYLKVYTFLSYPLISLRAKLFSLIFWFVQISKSFTCNIDRYIICLKWFPFQLKLCRYIIKQLYLMIANIIGLCLFERLSPWRCLLWATEFPFLL